MFKKGFIIDFDDLFFACFSNWVKNCSKLHEITCQVGIDNYFYLDLVLFFQYLTNFVKVLIFFLLFIKNIQVRYYANYLFLIAFKNFEKLLELVESLAESVIYFDSNHN
jgi:hypothetical protein